jgi:hypothetical protein
MREEITLDSRGKRSSYEFIDTQLTSHWPSVGSRDTQLAMIRCLWRATIGHLGRGTKEKLLICRMWQLVLTASTCLNRYRGV